MKNLYEIMATFAYYIEKIIGSHQFIFSASIIAITIKSFIFWILISRTLQAKKIQKPLILLFLIIIGSVIADFAWILTSAKQLFLIDIEYKYLRTITRITWSFYIIYYQALTLFIEDFSNRENKIGLIQKIFLFVSSTLVIFFVGLAFYQPNCYNPSMRPNIEILILKLSTIYMTFILMPISLFITVRKIKTEAIPKILQRQLKVFIQFIATPIWLADLIQVYPFTFITSTITNEYATVGISSLLITYGIFHCIRKIMNIRFLNFESHVQAPNRTKRFYFVDDFKNALERFTQSTSTSDLEGITQDFFSNAFNIQKNRTRLYIKVLNKPEKTEDDYSQKNQDELIIDSFMNNYGSPVNNSQEKNYSFFKKNKIIILDELEFNNFYDENEESYKMLQLMEKISADIFIPILENESSLENSTQASVFGYIVVEKNARINNENKNAPFYSNIERDQMLVYSNYLRNIIKLFQTHSLKQIIKQEKNLKEELHSKQQEIDQYKESLEYFSRNNESKKIGIIIYKNRKFEFENQAAQELIQVKLNVHNGHPITKKLKIIATQAAEYKSQQSCFITGQNDEKLIATAIPNTEKNSTTIIVYYPEASDILNKKTEFTKDNDKQNFLLYLETTKAGKLVDNFIPLDSENLLSFKINFLKTALNEKTVLVNSCQQDSEQVVEIMKKISHRDTLYCIDLKKPSENLDILIKLFGINSILESPAFEPKALGHAILESETIESSTKWSKSEIKKPILEKLDNCGTLFIKNAHFLDLETQRYLYEFIKYGYFKIFMGEKKTFSNVRIILSSDVNLQRAVQEDKFNAKLFNVLNEACITVPQISTLSPDELNNLITVLTEQAIKTEELQYVLELTESEKRKLIASSPKSFCELKNRIQQILIKKSKQSDIYQQAKIDNSYDLSDQQLIEAVKLGKNALKDIKIMSMLWNKYKNQNKIASLLGVNRSSINRRCKDYNLF